MLNKRGGAFTKEDEKRLAAFTSQISMGIENANFSMKFDAMNYPSMLSSMHDGVVTFDENGKVRQLTLPDFAYFSLIKNSS